MQARWLHSALGWLFPAHLEEGSAGQGKPQPGLRSSSSPSLGIWGRDQKTRSSVSQTERGNSLEAGRVVWGQPFEACDRGCFLLVTGPQHSREGLEPQPPALWGPRLGWGPGRWPWHVPGSRSTSGRLCAAPILSGTPHPHRMPVLARQPPGSSRPWVLGGEAQGLTLTSGGCRLRGLHHARPADELPPLRWGEAQGPAAAAPCHLL